MGRNRDRHSADRHLFFRDGHYHYKRKVPTKVALLDDRAPMVRMSLKTNDLAMARHKRDHLEAADDSLWASLIVDGVSDPARLRYQSAVRRVEALDFTFHPAAHLERPEAFGELAERFRFLMTSGKADLAEPLLGSIDTPRTTISEAFTIYCDEIVADELVGKSQPQKDQWKKVKQRAVNNFKLHISDKAMVDITRDDANKIYRHWLSRIVPKVGRPTATASSGNRDLGNLRVLYAAYFKHMGDPDRRNPFDGLSFSAKIKNSRPPIPTQWIKDKFLKPGALATLNDEARGILYIIVETGARPSEICNLDESTILLDASVPHLSIAPREDPDDPREIKTASSRRLVPLVGIALEAAKKHPHGFPRYRNRENDLSATLNKYLRENDLFPTAKHKVYSFRHSFEDRMKDGGLEDELRRILMGHTIDRAKYGSGGSLEWRQSELMKIVLPFDAALAAEL